MRIRVILSLVTLAVACFTLAVWSEPLPPDSWQTLPDLDAPDREQRARV
jgi:hypothetical protein